MIDFPSLILRETDDINELPDPIKGHIIEVTSKEYEHRDGELYVTELLYCLKGIL